MKSLVYTLFFGLLAHAAFSQVDGQVAAALKVGNSKEIAKLFSNNVELTILDKEGVYSKTQAELIIKDFFNSHQVENYTVIHNGGNDAPSKYVIGELKTDKQTFRVFYLLKTDGKQQIISQLRIETQEE